MVSEDAPSAVAAAAPQEEVLFEGRPVALPSVGALLLVVLTLGIAWLLLWIRALGTRYRVTSQRVVVETGVFSKRLEQVDLYRIVDYVVERPFLQRVMGTGNLVIQTIDKTSPEVRIAGVRADVVALYERLRIATEQAKRRRGVQLLDMAPQ